MSRMKSASRANPVTRSVTSPKTARDGVGGSKQAIEYPGFFAIRIRFPGTGIGRNARAPSRTVAMRSSKNFSYSLAALLLSCMLCAPLAQAASANFGVQVRVLGRKAAAAPVDVPVPPGARKLTATPEGNSYFFSGESRTATEFYHRAMAERGYRLVSVGASDAILTWERDGQRVRVRIDAVLGNDGATRILVGNADA